MDESVTAGRSTSFEDGGAVNEFVSGSRCVSFMIAVFVQDCFAASRENNLAFIRCTAVFDLDKALDECVFPNCLPWACAVPGLHGLIVGAVAARDPTQKL